MVFYHRTKPRETEAAPAGAMLEDIYKMTIDKTGHKSIKKSGKTNVYERTQAALEETKIETIIARAQAGDLTALTARHPQYFDASHAPRTLAQAQQMMIAISDEWAKLPMEVKNKFENSVDVYIAQYGSKAWLDATGIAAAQQAAAEAEKMTQEGGNESES